MRNELQEPGRGGLRTNKRRMSAAEALPASAVDAALADETAPLLAAEDARRDVEGRVASGARVAIDRPHAQDDLLTQLARQMTQLEVQQRQIRRLLEQTMQRAGS
jgi:hypothetical protein